MYMRVNIVSIGVCDLFGGWNCHEGVAIAQ